MLNLDTHILVHAMKGSLTAREAKCLKKDTWGISAIVLWELAALVKRKKIALNLKDKDVVRFLSRIEVWPVDLAVVQTLAEINLKGGDSADHIIAATSLVHGAALVTRDKIFYRSKKFPLAFKKNK